jgi:hypothetical protein
MNKNDKVKKVKKDVEENENKNVTFKNEKKDVERWTEEEKERW